MIVKLKKLLMNLNKKPLVVFNVKPPGQCQTDANGYLCAMVAQSTLVFFWSAVTIKELTPLYLLASRYSYWRDNLRYLKSRPVRLLF